MQNLQIYLYPKQLHYSSTQPIRVRVTYKKVVISTGHQLERYQNKEEYQVKNSIANINDQVKFKLSKELQFSNTKIIIVFIGVKGREVSLIGELSLDLVLLKEKKNKENQVFKVKLNQCRDPNSYFIFDIKFVEKPLDINQLKKSRKDKQKIPQLGMLKTQAYYKEELFISRRQKQDKPTAYEISRKNFKNVQIKRKQTDSQSRQKRDSKESITINGGNGNGSYKKRFMYEVQRIDKSRRKSGTKQLGSNYLKVYQKDKSPSPRTRTPQPITLDSLKSRQTKDRTLNKVQPLNLSGYSQNADYQSQQLIDPDTFRAHKNYENYHSQKQHPFDPLGNSNVSGSSSLEAITNEKDSKYKMITQKLQMIQSKIRKRKDQYSQSSQGGSLQKDQRQRKVPKSQQIEEIESYQVSQRPSKNQRPTAVTDRPRYYTQSDQGSPYQQTDKNQTRPQGNKSPLSPSDSTCPRNQLAPSPIQVGETPVMTKKPQEEIKMSEFTINSRKNQQGNDLQQQKSPSSQIDSTSQRNSFVNKPPFDQIIQPTMGSTSLVQKYIAPVNQTQQGKSRSHSPRDTSPPTLNFERRQSQLKLQKKSSIGQKYLETQVKMFELQIQQKDRKYEKLQRMYTKKQDECNRLIKDNEQYQRKITTLTNQLIEVKRKIIQLQGKNESQRTEELELNLKAKIRQIQAKDIQIIQLNEQILNFKLKIKTQKLSSQVFLKGKHDEVLSQRVNNDHIQNKKLQKQISTTNLVVSQPNSQAQQITSSISDKISIKEKQQEIRRFQVKIQVLQVENKDLNKKLDTLRQTIQQQKVSFQNIQSDIQKYREQNQQIKKKFSIQKHSNEVLMKQKLQIQQQIEQLKIQLQKQNGSVSSLQQTKPINLNVSSVKSLQQKAHSKSTQELINKTLQKQSLLENSLKKLQAENTNLKQKTLKLTQQSKLLAQQLQRKQRAIQKLSTVNQNLNIQIFNEGQTTKKKISQMDLHIDNLLMKNAEYELQINEMPASKPINQRTDSKVQDLRRQITDLNTRLVQKDKNLQLLKKLLRDKEDQQQSAPNIKNQSRQVMKRQVSHESSQPSLSGLPERVSLSHPNLSKSDQFKVNGKSPSSLQQQQNHYEMYMNEKAKSTNLEAQLRFAQNKVRSLSLQIDNLKLQKKDLQQEIDMISLNQDKQMAKKGVVHKVALQNKSISQTTKGQNKALKEEINVLQSHINELNILLDDAIRRTASFEPHPVSNSLVSPPQSQSLLNENYVALVRRLEAYQDELRSKKNKMAEIINAVWKGGNASLIDQIDKIMGVQE